MCSSDLGRGSVLTLRPTPSSVIDSTISSPSARSSTWIGPRSTGMGQRIVSAMAAKLEANVERDPAHAGTRIVVRFSRHKAQAVKVAASAAAK